MTREQFIQLVEAYYGRYERPAQRATVQQYLERFPESCCPTLYKRLILEYSGQYRFTPDVAILEDIKRKIDAEPTGWLRTDAKQIPESTEGWASAEERTGFLRSLLQRLRDRPAGEAMKILRRQGGGG